MTAYPLAPRSALDLTVGDFWAVSLPSGGFGAAQVRDVKRSGTGARTTFVAGVIEWRGEAPPTAEDLRGKRVLDQGLVSVDAFTKTETRLLGNQPDTKPAEGLTSAFRDFAVGTKTQTWGWKVLPQRVERVLLDRG